MDKEDFVRFREVFFLLRLIKLILGLEKVRIRVGRFYVIVVRIKVFVD